MKKLTLNLLAILALGFAAFMTSCAEEETTKVPVAGFTVESETVAKGEAVVFTNTSIDAVSYQWSFGDGEISTEESPTHTFTATGVTTVTLIATAGGKNQATKELTVGAEATEIYFIDNTEDVFTVKKLSGIGGSIKTETAFTTTGFSVHMIFDETSSKVYYSDDDNGQVVSVNLDGTGQEILLSDLNEPRGLALNDDGTKLYVAEKSGDAIWEVTLSDKSSKELYTLSNFDLPEDNYLSPVGLAYFNGVLYMTCVAEGAESVWSAKADGSDAKVKQLLNFDDAGYGYSIAVDAASSLLYIDNYNNNEIFSASLDGSSSKKVTITTGKVYGLAIYGNKIYFSDNVGAIRRYNLDESDAEDLSVDAARNNRGMFVTKAK